MTERLQNSVAFRVDAGHQIGTGHFVRCLTLAGALRKRGVRTRFVCRRLPEYLRGMLSAGGHELGELVGAGEPTDELNHASWLGTSQAADARETAGLLAGATWDWIVVDHYALDQQWERLVRPTGVPRLLVIDDLADRVHDCDLLLDQNLYGDGHVRYDGKVPDTCERLLGPRYALLREEFTQLHQTAQPRTEPVKRVMVFFGGVDGDNHTSAAIKALSEIGGEARQVDVVIGAEHPHRALIEQTCHRLQYVCHVQAKNMAELMAGADLAIGAGGSATWERCCVGLPTITLAIAENQRKLVNDCATAGIIYRPVIQGDLTAGLLLHIRALIEAPEVRRSISATALRTVDGLGVPRILQKLGLDPVQIRPATMEDSADLLLWRNDPSVRLVSHDTQVISFEHHARWLQSVLGDPQRILLIGHRVGHPVGVVRFDVKQATAEISIYLRPDLAGRGLGSSLLRAAEDWLQRHRPTVRSLKAEVLAKNGSSHQLFSAAGYLVHPTQYYKSIP